MPRVYVVNLFTGGNIVRRWKQAILGLIVCGTAATVAAVPQRQAGDVVWVALADLRPTQSGVAYEQINYRLAQYQNSRERLFSDLCRNAGWGKSVRFSAESTPGDTQSYQCSNAYKKQRNLSALKTAVSGPNNQLYLTDGHHTFSAFYDMPGGGADLKVPVYIDKIYQTKDLNTFWQQVEQDGNAWLFDAAGQRIHFQQIPKQLGRMQLQNDPFRAALYFLRDSVWAKPKPAIPYVEFYWAQHLKQQAHLKFPGYYSAAEYLQWLERIYHYIANLNGQSVIFDNYKAADLGWQGGLHFEKLDQLLCRRDHTRLGVGKLGLALQHRGMPVQCDSRQYLSNNLLSTGLSQLPVPLNADKSVNVLIEIAAGSIDKWQQQKANPLLLEWEEQNGTARKINYLPYPVNYGILPNTLSAKEYGGDGDPLDVLLLGGALTPGTLSKARIIGIMKMLDNGEQDDKLLAVPLTGVFSDIFDLSDLQQNFPSVEVSLQLWFEHYKGSSAQVSVLSFDNAAAAMAILKASLNTSSGCDVFCEKNQH
nr:ParB-like protein [Pseudoalteromonas sp.]